MTADKDLLAELQERGLVHQSTPQLAGHLGQPRALYCGFDPTADSLHVGSLLPIMLLRRFQLAGHRPIVVLGGATGLIGDPSFKAAERPLQDRRTIAERAERLRDQMQQFLDFDGRAAAMMVDNYDWTCDVLLLDFLRDIGKHFSVNAMVQRDSVRRRLDADDSGISFTEFSYALLQAFDFMQLCRRHDCTLQIGGSDQWGNIVAGIDLCRRINGARVHGLTTPLLTRADGQKFGKSESGTVWLDGARTSPYAFHQYWLGTADADVRGLLARLTLLPMERVAELADAGHPQAQQALADEMTGMVHGDDGLAAARRVAQALFSGAADALGADDMAALAHDGLPSGPLADALAGGAMLTQVLTATGLARSGKQAKDALQRGAVTINGRAVSMDDNERAAQLLAPRTARHGKYHLLRLGKKRHHLLVC